jgi:hypothetical protein
LAWNQNNVSEWIKMSTRGQLFQWASTIKIQLSVEKRCQEMDRIKDFCIFWNFWGPLCQFSSFSAISWWEQVNFQWDDDEFRFVLVH